MSDYSNFASRLNKAVYGQQAQPKQITMEDIAKCRGSSQSMPALLLNNLRIFFTKDGQILTNAKIREILTKNGADNIDEISELFREAPQISVANSPENLSKHSITKDQKMAADLGKIFGKAAFELQKNASTGNWQKLSTDAQDAHIILSGRRMLEKQNPVELLRSAAFEEQQGIKNEGMKKHFINFLNERGALPKNDQEVKEAYQEFIKNLVELASDDPTRKSYLKSYIHEHPHEQYGLQLSLEKSGLFKDENIATHFESLSAEDLLKPLHTASLKEKISDLATESDQAKVRKGLEELFLDKGFAEPVLEKASQKASCSEMYHFISAYLEYRELKPEDKELKFAEMHKRFLSSNAEEQVNIPAQLRADDADSLEAIYHHVVKTFIGNVLTKDDTIEEAIDAADIHTLREQEAPKQATSFANLDVEVDVKMMKKRVKPDEHGPF